MAVLITGGTGLVGSFVVRELLGMHEVPVVIDLGQPGQSLRDLVGRFPFVEGSITDLELLVRTIKDYKIDNIIHLASLLQFGCEQNPKRAIEVNVNGTLNVLEAACRMHVKKVVFASSIAVYGSQVGLIDENRNIPPDISLYGATKFLGEVLLERYNRIYGIPYIALRYWGVYGPGEVRSQGMAGVLKKIESIIFEKEVAIQEVGGQERAHFLFVKDAAQATVKALFAEKNVNKVFNIAGGEESYVSFDEFCQVVKRLFPSAGKAIFDEKKQKDRAQANISLARTELGYSPEYDLERGIQEDIEFFGNR